MQNMKTSNLSKKRGIEVESIIWHPETQEKWYVCLHNIFNMENPTKLKDNEMGRKIPTIVVGGTSGVLVVKNLPAVLGTQVRSLVGELRCHVPQSS